MVAANANPNKNTVEMIDKAQWTLKQIRDAYGEILRTYNALFPLHPEARMQGEDIIGADLDPKDDNFRDEIYAKAQRALPKLKEAADRSGFAAVWYCGEPLENLNEGMRERVERALKFGI